MARQYQTPGMFDAYNRRHGIGGPTGSGLKEDGWFGAGATGMAGGMGMPAGGMGMPGGMPGGGMGMPGGMGVPGMPGGVGMPGQGGQPGGSGAVGAPGEAGVFGGVAYTPGINGGPSQYRQNELPGAPGGGGGGTTMAPNINRYQTPGMFDAYNRRHGIGGPTGSGQKDDGWYGAQGGSAAGGAVPQGPGAAGGLNPGPLGGSPAGGGQAGGSGATGAPGEAGVFGGVAYTPGINGGPSQHRQNELPGGNRAPGGGAGVGGFGQSGHAGTRVAGGASGAPSGMFSNPFLPSSATNAGITGSAGGSTGDKMGRPQNRAEWDQQQQQRSEDPGYRSPQSGAFGNTDPFLQQIMGGQGQSQSSLTPAQQQQRSGRLAGNDGTPNKVVDPGGLPGATRNALQPSSGQGHYSNAQLQRPSGNEDAQRADRYARAGVSNPPPVGPAAQQRPNVPSVPSSGGAGRPAGAALGRSWKGAPTLTAPTHWQPQDDRTFVNGATSDIRTDYTPKVSGTMANNAAIAANAPQGGNPYRWDQASQAQQYMYGQPSYNTQPSSSLPGSLPGVSYAGAGGAPPTSPAGTQQLSSGPLALGRGSNDGYDYAFDGGGGGGSQQAQPPSGQGEGWDGMDPFLKKIIAGDQPQGNTQQQIAGMDTTGLSPVTSTIDASQKIYGNDLTQQQVNQAVAKARQSGHARTAVKQGMGRGMSVDEGQLSAFALPASAQGRSLANQAMSQIPLQNQFANRQYQLQGELARGQEAQGLANSLRRVQQTNIGDSIERERLRNYQLSSVMNPLFQTLMTGVGGLGV